MTLCAPHVLSDGSSYCMPEVGTALYSDARCSRGFGRVVTGAEPRAFFATQYRMGETTLPSQVFRAGESVSAPAQRYEVHDGECIGPYELDAGFDYVALGPRVELARVRFIDAGNGLDEFVGDGVRLPWRFRDCDVLVAPNRPSTICAPRDATRASYFTDSACSMPVVTAFARPSLAYVQEGACRRYYDVGNEVSATDVFERIADRCVASSISGSPTFFTIARPHDVATFDRVSAGSTRLQPIAVGPLFDPLMHDTELATDCQREALACVPAGAARVELWFADPQCGVPVEVAMVSTAPCTSPTSYARKGDTFFPIGAPYPAPLYQLEPGDRCGLYVPTDVAHSIGPALPTDAFARATLVIRNDP